MRRDTIEPDRFQIGFGGHDAPFAETDTERPFADAGNRHHIPKTRVFVRVQIVEFFYAFDGTRVNPGFVVAALRSFREVVQQEFLRGGCQQVANTSSVREPSPRFPLGSASEEISPFARRTGLLSRGVLTRSNRNASFVRMAKHRIAVSETMPISGLIKT